MQPHIAKTIEDIELKIAFLQRMAHHLKNFGAVFDVGGAPAVENGHALPIATPVENSHARRNGLKALRVRNCKPSKHGAETTRIVGVVGKMLEPVTATLIASKANVDPKRAANFITFSLKKGWLSRAGRGEYSRTKVFGGGGQPWRANPSGDLSRN
jgi:hypothetical protein